MTAPSILVIGSGGIGGLYGSLLHKAGWRVSMLARSDHQHIAAQGLKVESILGDLSFRPEQVYASLSSLTQPFDWILLTVKMLDQQDLPSLIAPVVGPNTVIALIANGLDIERPLAHAFPHHSLISGVAFVATQRVQPGVIAHSAYGRLVLGNYQQPTDSHCQNLANAFRQSGIEVGMSDDIVRERWKKSIWNACFNPLSVLTNGADTQQLLQIEPLLRELMAEVIACAGAEGYALNDELIEKNLANTRTMGAYHTSMALDYLHGAPIELEAILGSVLRYGQQHQLALPHLNTLYQALRVRYSSADQTT